MNYRVLAQRQNAALFLLRVVKHELADRDHVNFYDRAETILTITSVRSSLSDVHGALLSFGVGQAETGAFRMCYTENDLLYVAQKVSEVTTELVIRILETSEIISWQMNSQNDPQASFAHVPGADNQAYTAILNRIRWLRHQSTFLR